ncbi:MAG: MbcA/ParS/Xre antitoxin family protein [bacterium]
MSVAVVYSQEQMLLLTESMINYLDEWKLSPEQMINILGLPENTKSRHLQQYRSMSKALPQTDDTMKRIEHIRGIADALRTTFPFSNQMRYLWLRKPHRRFSRQRPLEVILNDGVEGLVRVRMEVDCSYGWSISEAMREASETKSE